MTILFIVILIRQLAEKNPVSKRGSFGLRPQDDEEETKSLKID